MKTKFQAAALAASLLAVPTSVSANPDINYYSSQQIIRDYGRDLCSTQDDKNEVQIFAINGEQAPEYIFINYLYYLQNSGDNNFGLADYNTVYSDLAADVPICRPEILSPSPSTMTSKAKL